MARKAGTQGTDGERVPFVAQSDDEGNVLNVVTEEQIDEIAGEVEDIPGQFTILRRLKDLLTGIILAAGTNIIGAFRSVDPNNDTRFAGFDSKIKAPLVQQTEHAEIHKGDSFKRRIDSGNSAVASLNVAFKTLPGIKLAHMLFGLSSNDEVLFEIVEDASWTQGSGTALNIVNVNRDDGGNSSLLLEDKNQEAFTANNQVMKDVTGVSGGTVIDPQFTYNAGLGASVVAESRASVHEWVLKNNTTYVIRMTQTDGNCKMSINILWYEHTDE